MIFTPTSRRIIRPYDKPSFEYTQRHGLIRGHPLGPAGGLVAHYPFNEGSGNKVFDLSGNGNTGTLVADTHFVPGKFGSALDFDGTGDYVNCGTNDILDFTSENFTIFVWVKFDSLDTTVELVTKGVKGTNGWQFARTSHPRIYFYTSQTDTQQGSWANIGDSVLNQWYHIVGVREGESCKIFRDGVDITGWDPAHSDPASSSDPLEIGNGLNGEIDHVMLYNRILSASEIAQLYREPFCMVQKQPARIYFFVPIAVGEVKELAGTVAIESTVIGELASPIRELVGTSVIASTVIGELSKTAKKALAGTVAIKSTVTGDIGPYRLSNYSENAILEHLVGKTPFTMPTAYVALSTTNPKEDGSGISEPSDGYSRVATTSGDWNNAVDGTIDNKNALTFPEASGNWGEITHYAVFDAAEGGNMLAYDALDVSKTINVEEIMQFAANDLKMQLD